MTGHSESLSKTCRLCASKFDAGEDKYSVKNVWFLEFLTKNYENVPDFSTPKRFFTPWVKFFLPPDFFFDPMNKVICHMSHVTCHLSLVTYCILL